MVSGCIGSERGAVAPTAPGHLSRAQAAGAGVTLEQQQELVRLVTTTICDGIAEMAEEIAQMPVMSEVSGTEALLSFAEAVRKSAVDKFGAEPRA